MEDRARDGCGLGENVTRRGVVLPALVTRSVLPVGQQEVQVVAPDIVLCEVDDRHRQTLFAVVVCRVLRDISDELCDLWYDIMR